MALSSHRTLAANRALVVATGVALFVAALAATGRANPGAEDRGRNRVIPGPISADGRITSWVSSDENIVANDTNGEQDVFARDLLSGETRLVSVGDHGQQGNGASSDPAPSGDGRYITFMSDATNLISGQSSRKGLLYVRDLVTGTTEMVSMSSSGEPANDRNFDAVMSMDGRFVAFQTTASNLDPRDTNRFPDIYLHDRETKTTQVVSVDGAGVVKDGGALYPDLSPDGRYVAFQSYATLVPQDTNTLQDIYVHDVQTGQTEIVSVSTRGTQGDADSRQPSISEDGRFVAFASTSKLVPQDTNNASDIFVRDRQADITRRVTVTSSGAEAQSGNAPFTPGSHFASISPEGRYVAYQSDAPNLMPGDTGDWDVFVHDLETGSTTLGARGLDGSQPNKGAGIPEIGADGRYMTFISTSTNLVPEPTQFGVMAMTDRGPSAGIGALTAEVVDDTINAQGWATFSGEGVVSERDPSDDAGEHGLLLGSELTGVSIAMRPGLGDLFLRWELEHLPAISTQAAIAPGIFHVAAFELNGVRLEIRAARVGGARTPFFGLFRCDPTCAEVQELQGGYGESGMEITTSVELAALGIDGSSAVLRNVTASAGPGEAATGMLESLDDISVGEVLLSRPEISIGVARAGTDRDDVVFDRTATPSDGLFTSVIPAGDLAPGRWEVWARGCLGDRCGVAATPVTIARSQGTTELSFTDASALSGQFSDATRFAAQLTDQAGDPLSGREIIFELVGSGSLRTFSATTGEAGTATVTPELVDQPGAHQLTARYLGDEGYAASDTSTPFTIDAEDTILRLEEGKKRLVAVVTDADSTSNAVAGGIVDFYSRGELIGSAPTDDDGRATFALPPGHRGNRTYKAAFAGDGYYLGSSDELAGK